MRVGNAKEVPAASTTSMNPRRISCRMSWNSLHSWVVNQAMTSMSSDDAASSLNLTTTASGQNLRMRAQPLFQARQHLAHLRGGRLVDEPHRAGEPHPIAGGERFGSHLGELPVGNRDQRAIERAHPGRAQPDRFDGPHDVVDLDEVSLVKRFVHRQ